MTNVDIESVRTQLQALSDRVGKDDQLRQRLIENPETVLQAAGLPEHVVAHLVSELQPQAEVQGYIPPRCDPWTCIITYCSFWTTGEGWHCLLSRE